MGFWNLTQKTNRMNRVFYMNDTIKPLTRSKTFNVRIIAPAARTAKATANTSDCKRQEKKNRIRGKRNGNIQL